MLFAVPRGEVEPARLAAPVQVSLLDPAPASDAAASAAAAPEPPVPIPPVKPPVPKPIARPVPQPVPESPPTPTPEPTPTTAPVAAMSAQTATGASASASSSASAESTGASGSTDALVEACFDADYLRNPKPIYPAMSRRMREEGKVMLHVHVQPDGNPQEIEIKRSSGSTRLDEATNKAAVWTRGDTVSHIIVIVLVVMSIASWSIMLGKTWLVWALRHKTPRALENFWDSATITAGLEKLAP
ncbi:MAG: energy transducer TonB [Zoogloeaceae bacterium]|nr:energy transducer TonB [Zoogloeaceae bacterium]